MHTLIIADHHPAFRQMARNILNVSGYIVEEVNSGFALLTLLQSNDRSLVILLDDEFLRDDPEVYAALMTGGLLERNTVIEMATSNHHTIALELHPVATLMRPCSVDDLRAVVAFATNNVVEPALTSEVYRIDE